MTGKPLLFHQTAEQLRRVSARGGRASARHRRRHSRFGGSVPLAAPLSCSPLPSRAGWKWRKALFVNEQSPTTLALRLPSAEVHWSVESA